MRLSRRSTTPWAQVPESMTVTMDNAQITTLRALTQDLLRCAQSGEWGAVAEYERKRKPILFAVFDASSQGTSQQRGALLNEILMVDREVLQLAGQHRGELAVLLRRTGQGRAVLKAYDTHSR